jgi:hypothetical protein
MEVNEVLLEREAQTFGHYLHRFGRIDGFTPTWLDWALPMRRFNVRLRAHLPKSVWGGILPALLYINLRQIGLMLENRVPALKGATRPVRNIAANLFHRRWRAKHRE